MKDTEFNLLDEGWVLARKNDCTVDVLSLTDAILRSHEYSCLSGELPTQDISILRLLLAVLHTVFSRYSPDGEEEPLDTTTMAFHRWSQLWNAGRFPEKPIRNYLASQHEKFWLFHPDRPFYQTNAAENGTVYSSAKLNGTILESSNKARLFAGCSGMAKGSLSYSEAARWLLCVNNYDDTSAKPKNKSKDTDEKAPSPGAGWLGKLGLITVSGNSLFDTLMLNLILTGSTEVTEKPIWELEKTRDRERVQIAPPDNLSELYTLQSRRLKLIRENNSVTGYTLLGGDFFDEIDAFIEPMTVWRPINASKSAKVSFKPKRHDSSVQLWREFASSFKFSKQSYVPGIVRWISSLKKNRSIDSAKFIKFSIASVQYGDKDFFVNNIFSDSITFHTDLLTEFGRHWQDKIAEEIEKCDNAANSIGLLARNIAIASGASGEAIDKCTAVTTAKERFYYEIDIPFRKWLESIDPNWEYGSDEEKQALNSWHQTAAKTALRIGRELVSSAGTAATVGRYITTKDKKDNSIEFFYSSPEAFKLFRLKINKIYP